ncbi:MULTISPECIES: anti-phage dCTP deaminase [Methylobacterium]|uniref:anti-phage dCTP deaminase n=1 Tax=Methylobacterium TaxID=407 RepID=UPI0013EBF129|nr:anti-phage dCTP deaminase [Methylobacterium sp. DB0501]NGM34504.1 deoxycytidylate deaminase [Methylobacterium sp. DB0501]
MSVNNKQATEYPELFFPLCGAIGVNLELVSNVLQDQLKLFGYKTVEIHQTQFLQLIDDNLKNRAETLNEHYKKRIKSANDYRKLLEDKALMAHVSLFLIQGERNKITKDPLIAAPKVAYIIRQLKRTEEIELFRELYGKQVFQISAYMDPIARKTRLATKMRDYDNTSTRISDFEGEALNLVKLDDNEPDNPYGQRLRDVYPLADVFIDASTSDSAKKTIGRFVKILFGYNFHSPSRDEYGMYVAKSASLRSVDLSRQVGAAVFSPKGEVKVLGCNEVPSPSGGTYWEDDRGDAREFKIGWDTNENFKYRLLGDTLKQLEAIGLIEKKYVEMSTRDFLASIKEEKKVDLTKRLMMMDVIEYGRIIHAEMNAITDAARKGISIDGDVLYCTTFPCHLCAKHIISAGIKRVVYIEPYPKSYATELYIDDISLERSESDLSKDRVHFEPFIGVAPYRYRDYFEKSKRKDGDGKALEWKNGAPKPDIKIKTTAYIDNEFAYLQYMLSQFAAKGVMLSDEDHNISNSEQGYNRDTQQKDAKTDVEIDRQDKVGAIPQPDGSASRD